MKIAKSFTYCNKNTLEDFGLNMVLADNEEINLGLSREVLKGSITKFRDATNHLGAKFSEVLSFPITLIKRSKTGNQEELKWSREEIRNLTSWLTSVDVPQLLEFQYKETREETIDYFGLFTDISTYNLDNIIYGITLTFTCSSSFGYTKENSYKCSANSKIVIDNTSDKWNDYVYPKIEIVPSVTGSITITNITDERKSISLEVKNQNTVYVDCQNNLIYDKAGVLTLSDLGITVDDLDTLYWLRLVHGENIIQVDGNAEVTIKCRYERKVGEI